MAAGLATAEQGTAADFMRNFSGEMRGKRIILVLGGIDGGGDD
jgi:hypothetical protein